ncbi:MAG: hypothetical protein OMM_06477 [Candidatus Magnetoglobus multicellularis str. Araruama]|uniref:Chemotaxis phosphatase CheX-like domain-containing protein n=1 Tax=Candidatus Magnetoglobus multicellularis str. Araruama TaxID=890399 RepID=A0A1V1PHB4_9BACT|nr:MAG: hypothetical protein OMM_06477 [Candidatus Magnetoglobus multicellularis str. Araruama]
MNTDQKMNTDQLIEKTIHDVFENMYFMFPERTRLSPDIFSFPISCYMAQTQLIKDSQSFDLYGDNNLVNKMAMNFLGEKRAFEHVELIDIFREATNVIIGNYLSAINKPLKVRFNIPSVSTKTILTCEKDQLYDIDQVYIIENYFFRIALTG